MTSSLDLSTIDRDNLSSSENSKWSLDFDDHILKLYAQEIEENQINEIIEAQLQNISVENSHRTSKELIKKYSLNPKKPIPPPKLTITSKTLSRSMENQISELKSKVIHIKQNIEEETQKKSNSNKTKPIVPPRLNKNLGAIPKNSFSYLNKESLTTNTKAKLLKKPQPESEAKNLTTFNPIINSDQIFQTAPCTDHFSHIQVKDIAQCLPEISNSSPIPEMANIEITQTVEESDDSGYMRVVSSSSTITPPSLPSRPPPVYKYIPGTSSKTGESSMKILNQTFSVFEQSQNTNQRNESSTGIHSKGYVSNERKGFSNATNRSVLKPCFLYTDQSDVNKDSVPQIQNFSAVFPAEETHKSSKLVNFSEKINEKSEVLAAEKSRRSSNINIYENHNSSILVGDAKKIITKPHVPKKPSKQAIKKHIEQILTKQLNNSEERRTSKQNYEATENIPSNNVRFDKDSQDTFNNADSFKTDMKIINGRIAEITFFDKDKVRKMVGSSEHVGSFNSERKFSTEGSPINQGKDGQKEKQRKTSQHNLSDLDSIFDSITRPELPQKLRSTQRSISYNSLVQSFKDFSVAIWNSPLDKDKRNSVGDISIINEDKDTETRSIEPTTRNRNSISSNEGGISCKRRSVSDIEQGAINHFSWFHDVKISEANQRLLEFAHDGAFLIRPSSKPTVNVPYTASVILSGKIFNIHIRHKDGRQYAIGKEKEGEMTFSSVSDMVKYHHDVPFEMCLSRNTTRNVYFRETPPR